MSSVQLDNARDPEQLRRMEELVRTGQCHFCREGFEKKHSAPIIYESDTWFVTENNYPYAGSVHHYLIVPKIHVTQLRDLPPGVWEDLQTTHTWLENYLGIDGSSLMVRSGNMKLTCATLNHLHFHLIVGIEKTGTEKNKAEDLILAAVGYKKK